MKKKNKIIIAVIAVLLVVGTIQSITNPDELDSVKDEPVQTVVNDSSKDGKSETPPESANVPSETDLEIVTRSGHPTYYGSVKLSHTIWDDVEKDKILFGDENGTFDDKTILSMDAYEDSDLIRSICISFSNFDNPVTFTIEDVLPIIASYMPYDIMDKYYQYSNSKLLVPDNTAEKEKYYIITYGMNDAGKTDSNEYSGSIDVIVTINKNENVDNFSIGFGTPRWMSSLNVNGYHQKNWECNLYDYK